MCCFIVPVICDCLILTWFGWNVTHTYKFSCRRPLLSGHEMTLNGLISMRILIFLVLSTIRVVKIGIDPWMTFFAVTQKRSQVLFQTLFTWMCFHFVSWEIFLLFSDFHNPQRLLPSHEVWRPGSIHPPVLKLLFKISLLRQNDGTVYALHVGWVTYLLASCTRTWFQKLSQSNTFPLILHWGCLVNNGTVASRQQQRQCNSVVMPLTTALTVCIQWMCVKNINNLNSSEILGHHSNWSRCYAI